MTRSTAHKGVQETIQDTSTQKNELLFHFCHWTGYLHSFFVCVEISMLWRLFYLWFSTKIQGWTECFFPQEQSLKLFFFSSYPIYTDVLISFVFLIFYQEWFSLLPHFVHACKNNSTLKSHNISKIYLITLLRSYFYFGCDLEYIITHLDTYNIRMYRKQR